MLLKAVLTERPTDISTYTAITATNSHAARVYCKWGYNDTISTIETMRMMTFEARG